LKPAGAVFDKAWRDACDVIPAGRGDAAAGDMIRRHYLRKWPGVCMLVLVMRHRGAAAGVIVFALPPRETSRRYGGETWELARLWIDDAVPANAETWLIGQAVRHVRRHHPAVAVLVSYADPSAGHGGTIYKAANWRPDGRTDDERRSPRCDYESVFTGKRYSRRGHVPAGDMVERVPRVSKHRFVYRMR
jgi:hypothetical protein